MGFFDGRRQTPKAVPSPVPMTPSTPPATPVPAAGPPELIQSIQVQQAYWTANADEAAALSAASVEALGWPDLLRLHHLTCLRRATGRGAADPCERITRRLLAADSPYRPRVALVWQGRPASGAEAPRPPDMQRTFFNPSITHLGCLEVMHLDAENHPVRLDFVSFDDLSGIILGPASLFRAAKLFYEGRPPEIVRLPLLYGTTWTLGTDHERSGRLTRFIPAVDIDDIKAAGVGGVGIGQQDLIVTAPDGGGRSLLGLGSVAEVSFPLDMGDPRFDAKARARGMDPDDLRRRMTGGE
jgi:hypothetical protein